jgi:hypothetical protein
MADPCASGHDMKFDRNEGGFTVMKCSRCGTESKIIA